MLKRIRKNHVDKRRLTLGNGTLRNRKSQSYEAFLTECYPDLDDLTILNKDDQLKYCSLKITERNFSIDSALDNDERKPSSVILDFDQCSIITASKLTKRNSDFLEEAKSNEISNYSDEYTFVDKNEPKNSIQMKAINPHNVSGISDNQSNNEDQGQLNDSDESKYF